MALHVDSGFAQPALCTRNHLIPAQHATNLVLRDYVALASLLLAHEHGVEDVFIIGHHVGRVQLEHLEAL